MEAGDTDLYYYKKEYRELNELKFIAKAVGKALIHIHKKGYLLCDLKLENIVMKGRNPLLIDFGLAQQIGNTYTNSCMGTRLYFAPECNVNPNTLQTEYYSFGIFLLMLFSVYSHENNKNNIQALKLNVDTCANSIRDDDINEFNGVFLGLCEKDPSKRMSIEEALKSKFFITWDIEE
jgi:serine/threonine protein kinase